MAYLDHLGLRADILILVTPHARNATVLGYGLKCIYMRIANNFDPFFKVIEVFMNN